MRPSPPCEVFVPAQGRVCRLAAKASDELPKVLRLNGSAFKLDCDSGPVADPIRISDFQAMTARAGWSEPDDTGEGPGHQLCLAAAFALCETLGEEPRLAWRAKVGEQPAAAVEHERQARRRKCEHYGGRPTIPIGKLNGSEKQKDRVAQHHRRQSMRGDVGDRLVRSNRPAGQHDLVATVRAAAFGAAALVGQAGQRVSAPAADPRQEVRRRVVPGPSNYSPAVPSRRTISVL